MAESDDTTDEAELRIGGERVADIKGFSVGFDTEDLEPVEESVMNKREDYSFSVAVERDPENPTIKMDVHDPQALAKRTGKTVLLDSDGYLHRLCDMDIVHPPELQELVDSWEPENND